MKPWQLMHMKYNSRNILYQKERVTFIDTMRGFSLFWILLSNLLVFQGIYYAEDSEKWLDQQMYHTLVLWVVDSGLPIFTLLFGYSVVKLYESLHRKGRNSRWFFLRRAAGLYALGYVHSFVFESDILRTYGLMLLYLLFLVRLPGKWLIAVLTICYSLNVSLYFMEGILQSLGMYEMFNGMWMDLLFTIIITPIPILPMMVLGMILAKYKVFHDLERERKWYMIGFLLIPIGLYTKYISLSNPFIYLFDNGEVLALGYIFLVAWLCSYGKGLAVQQMFSSVGQLSLTNYLMQSIICTLIFVFFGVGNSLGALGGVLFGFVFYALQCMISVLYLRSFDRGPFEYLLRVVTNWSWKGKIG